MTMIDIVAATQTDAKAVEIQTTTGLAEVGTLIASRLGDILIAIIVLASIGIGHVL
jgi:hypothetical protein